MGRIKEVFFCLSIQIYGKKINGSLKNTLGRKTPLLVQTKTRFINLSIAHLVSYNFCLNFSPEQIKSMI